MDGKVRWMSTADAAQVVWEKPEDFRGEYISLYTWLGLITNQFRGWPTATIEHHVTQCCTSRVQWALPNGLQAVYYYQLYNDNRHPITGWGGARMGDAHALVPCGTQRQRGHEAGDWLAAMEWRHMEVNSTLQKLAPEVVKAGEAYWPLYRLLPRRLFGKMAKADATTTLASVLEAVFAGTERYTPHTQPRHLAVAWQQACALKWPIKAGRPIAGQPRVG